MRGDDRQATGGAARHVAEQGQVRCRRVVEDSRVCVWDTATEISWISWDCAILGVAPGSDAQRISTRRRAVNDISIMLSLEERDRLARSTRVPAPSCQGEPFTFLCPVITRATLGLGSFQVRERGCPGRLLRPTSLWASEFRQVYGIADTHDPRETRRIKAAPIMWSFSIGNLTRQVDLILLTSTVVVNMVSVMNACRCFRSLTDAHIRPAPDRR